MNEISDSKGIYAQSSDIKSRTYLQYRADMKKKAIVELEIMDWLESILKIIHNTENVTLEKSGGDSQMWFLRSGRISGEPDYAARIDGTVHNFEFQCAYSDELPFYDFKVSKVGNKIKGRRIAHLDRVFLYIIMPSNQFAFFPPQWVMENGIEAGVPAWGNRTAFRVPRNIFKPLFQTDSALVEEILTINKKIKLLEIQSKFIEREQRTLSSRIQNVVDAEAAFQIIPKTLDGFYEACFLMNQLNKRPQNQAMWLTYGASFLSSKMDSKSLARLVYSLDFLYGGSDDIEENVLDVFVNSMKCISTLIESAQVNKLQTCTNLSPREEIVNFLFTVNLYEDIVQELRYLYRVKCFHPVRKIFQTVTDLDQIYSRC